MRGSIEQPGVGNYNPHQLAKHNKAVKWMESKSKSKSEAKTKMPPVGTYDPVPAQFGLFSSIGSLSKNKRKSVFNKS